MSNTHFSLTSARMKRDHDDRDHATHKHSSPDLLNMFPSLRLRRLLLLTMSQCCEFLDGRCEPSCRYLTKAIRSFRQMHLSIEHSPIRKNHTHPFHTPIFLRLHCMLTLDTCVHVMSTRCHRNERVGIWSLLLSRSSLCERSPPYHLVRVFVSI